MARASQLLVRLREAIDSFPVIDCHEHTVGPGGWNWPLAAFGKEPLAHLLVGYLEYDVETVIYPGWQRTAPGLPPARSGTPEAVWAYLIDHQVSTEAKWPVFERLWRQTEHTAFARVVKRILKEVYGEGEMSLAAVKRVGERLLDLTDPEVYRQVLDKANIRCRLTDISWLHLKGWLAGSLQLYERDRLVFQPAALHWIRSWQDVADRMEVLGATATNLDDYLAACREILHRAKKLGAVGLKDAMAYARTLAYSNPSRAEVEGLFNDIMADPRRSLGWPEAKPLSDYLMHRILDTAAELQLPVQWHTGYVPLRNDIAKVNAVHLTSLIELHREVRFDLFHGNWPYMGEYLYLAKNYPNVRLNLTCAQIVDPRYCLNLLSEAVGAVPHNKIHVFGGDHHDDTILHAMAHLSIALDVMAAALAEQVASGWIDEQEALQIAADWLYNNPNEYFSLGFEPFRP